MLKMIQSVKFKQVNNPFLDKLKEDTDRIKNEPKLIIAADKTTNFYKLEPSAYNDLPEKNITKSYKKAQPETTLAIHEENKAIATKLRIDDANFRIVNGRCHFLRSLPFHLTVDAFYNGRCHCCSRGTMGENAKT